MRIDIVSIFPDVFEAPLSSSMLGLARETGLLELGVRQEIADRIPEPDQGRCWAELQGVHHFTPDLGPIVVQLLAKLPDQIRQ